MPRYPVKTALAIVTFGALAVLPEVVPELRNYRYIDWGSFALLFEFVPHDRDLEPLAQENLRLHPDKAHSSESAGAGGANSSNGLFRPGRHLAAAGSLEHFYQALYRTERREPEAITRIAHYGDSPTTADLITADVRSLFQTQFGDAGHGFVLIARPWAWYGHRGVDVSAGGWHAEPASQSGDGIFGFGGVSFRGGPGAHSTLSLRGAGHTAVEIAYFTEPVGGLLELRADGTSIGQLSTSGGTPGPAFERFALPSTVRQLSLQVISGNVRVFGVQLRKAGTGVVYDSLGLNGAYISVLARFFDSSQWTEQLRHYRPDLVVVNYGTNESMYAGFVDNVYSKEMKEVVRRLRLAVPEASILVMSPMDRGQRDITGEIATAPLLPRLVNIEQKVAADTGCAFFNTYEAMGGFGTMGRWYRAEPRLVGGDFIHPMPAGAKLVGTMLYRALMEGYNRYKLDTMHRNLAQSESIGNAPAAPAATIINPPALPSGDAPAQAVSK
jgi:lysophospholipase L1-like esterase